MRPFLVALLLLLGAFGGYLVANRIGDPERTGMVPRIDVATIANSSLRSAQRQARLSVFAARFVVAVTSRHETLGIGQTKTMIVPGLVRYELDWNRIGPADLAWNAATATLRVRAPRLEVSAPAVELTRIQEYADGKLLMLLTGAGPALDAANRSRVLTEMQVQAREPGLVALADAAARDAVARTFTLPLAAVGVPARVEVEFVQ